MWETKTMLTMRMAHSRAWKTSTDATNTLRAVNWINTHMLICACKCILAAPCSMCYDPGMCRGKALPTSEAG
jgi:hypothetical protein